MAGAGSYWMYRRTSRARPYLEKALAARETLPPAIAAEVDDLMRKVGR